MKLKTVTLSSKGQIAIPLDFRESVGFHRGDQLVIIQEGNKLLIEKAAEFANGAKDDFQDLVKLSEESLKSVWDNEADEIWQVYLKDRK